MGATGDSGALAYLCFFAGRLKDSNVSLNLRFAGPTGVPGALSWFRVFTGSAKDSNSLPSLRFGGATSDSGALARLDFLAGSPKDSNASLSLRLLLGIWVEGSMDPTASSLCFLSESLTGSFSALPAEMVGGSVTLTAMDVVVTGDVVTAFTGLCAATPGCSVSNITSSSSATCMK